MRIVHIISAPAAGGAEIYVKDLAIEQTKSGYSVSIFFIQTAEESRRCRQFERGYLSELELNEISYFFIGARSRRNPIWGACKLNRCLKSFKPEIVHVHLYWGLAFLFLLAFKKFKVVYTHHSISLNCPKWLYSVWNTFVSSYVGICSACTRLLISAGAKNTITIHNAVREERLGLSRSNPTTGDEQLKIIAVGSLINEKAYHVMIEACAKLKPDEFLLHIAGEGPLRAELEELVSQKGLEKNVIFLGNITNVNEKLARADLFLMTSDVEGLPISLLEATLMGLPAIVTNVGGCAEVIGSVANGFVAEIGNIDQISIYLKRMSQDIALRERLSINARKFSAQFVMGNSVEKHDLLYRRLNYACPKPRDVC